MKRFLCVKTWQRFQHYKDRDPPWVKLYRDTLTTEAWVLGTDLSRLLLIASTMLAARYSNKIPLNFPMLKKVASLDCDEAAFMRAVTHLVDAQFLEIQEDEPVRKHSASIMLATSLQPATSETETEAEAEKSREDKDSRRAASGGSEFDAPDDPRLGVSECSGVLDDFRLGVSECSDDASIDKALFAEARKIFGKSIGGQINTAIRSRGKPWILSMIESCRRMDPQQARAYLAAALNGQAKPDEAEQRRRAIP